MPDRGGPVSSIRGTAVTMPSACPVTAVPGAVRLGRDTRRGVTAMPGFAKLVWVDPAGHPFCLVTN